MYNTGVCEKTLLLCQRLPCSPAAETDSVFLFRLTFPRIFLSVGVFFSETGIFAPYPEETLFPRTPVARARQVFGEDPKKNMFK